MTGSLFIFEYHRLNNHSWSYPSVQVKTICYEKSYVRPQLKIPLLQNNHHVLVCRTALHIIPILSLRLLKTCTQVEI